MNKPDGSVFIEAEGDETSLQKLMELCYSGPERAVVESVHHEKEKVKGFEGFEVRRV